MALPLSIPQTASQLAMPGTKILVLPDEPETIRKSGLVLPTALEQMRCGTVIWTGFDTPEVRFPEPRLRHDTTFLKGKHEFRLAANGLYPGVRLIFGNLAGAEIFLAGVQHFIIDYSEAVMVLNGDEVLSHLSDLPDE